MITEDYVSFETAKLLKEKGFDESCFGFYTPEKELHFTLLGETNSTWLDDSISAPTLQMVMKWLREIYKLEVRSTYDYDKDSWWGNINPMFEETDENSDIYQKALRFDYQGKSYEQAAEAAIKYCLKNLIKNEDEDEESNIPVPKTVDEAISTLEKILSDEDREYLLENGAISMHDSLGRWIRNEWGLWTGSELKNELVNMNKGLNHPDDMSNYIIEEFIKYWNNKV